jgi:hypothetical protein
MKSFKDILLEKLKVTKNHNIDYSTIEYDDIDKLKPGSKEKAEAIFDVLKERYADILDIDKMRILKTNNIDMGTFIESLTNKRYSDDKFVLYINNPDYLIRKTAKVFGSYSNGTPGQFVKGFETLHQTLNKFDEKLRKNGYM